MNKRFTSGRHNKIGASGQYACIDCFGAAFYEGKAPKKYKRPSCASCGGNVEYFDSKRELKRWRELKMLERCGEVRNLQFRPKFKLYSYGMLVGTYTADSARFEGNKQIIEDVKGFMNSPMEQAFKLRCNLMKANYGINVEVYK